MDSGPRPVLHSGQEKSPRNRSCSCQDLLHLFSPLVPAPGQNLIPSLFSVCQARQQCPVIFHLPSKQAIFVRRPEQGQTDVSMGPEVVSPLESKRPIRWGRRGGWKLSRREDEKREKAKLVSLANAKPVSSNLLFLVVYSGLRINLRGTPPGSRPCFCFELMPLLHFPSSLCLCPVVVVDLSASPIRLRSFSSTKVN